MASAAEPGLSVKERLAMLQSGGSANPLLGGASKPATIPKPKPTPGGVAPKPAGGPATPLKPTGVVKPVPPSSALKPTTPAVALKPGGPGNVVRPVTPAKPSASDAQKPVFPVLRHVEKPDDKGKKPGAGVTPLVPKKPAESETKDKTDETPRGRPLSIAERMAALNQKTGGDKDSKPVENGTGPKSPMSPKSPGPLKSPISPRIPAEFGVKKLAHLPDSAHNQHFASPKSDIGSGSNTMNGVAHRPKGPAKPSDGRKSSELFLRHSDQKKFRRVELPSEKTSAPPPPKPSKLDNVDLTAFVLEYAKAKEQVLKEDSIANGEAVDGEMEELYVEAESTSVPVRASKGSLKRSTSVRVSKIPELTEEEEAEEFYDDCESAQPTPSESQEVYDDCASGVQDEDPQEVYEAFPEDEEETPPPPLPSPPPSSDKKKEQEKEKEKEKDKHKEVEKEKEKDKDGKKKGKDESKKEEKERKKREEEIRKQRNKFGLKDTDEKVGEGVVLHDEPGSSWLLGKDLAVSQGEMVTILRIDKNPQGKWLVQNAAGKLGFVNANNMEIATPTIRHVMTGVKGEQAAPEGGADEGPDEIYEEVPTEGEGEGEMDDIYEEC